MACWDEWKPVLVMVVLNIVFAVMNSMIKTVIDDGMDSLLIVTLRQLVATIFMAPIAYITERKTRPKLTTKVFLYLFCSGILGASLTQYLFFIGLQYTSATFSSAFLNITPVMTFIIALPFRAEAFNLKRKPGLAKVAGTVVCLAGAMLLTFYKGPVLTDRHQVTSSHGGDGDQDKGRWMRGSIALIIGTISWASWFLLQSRVGKMYPALYTSALLTFFFSFIQAAALSVAMQKGILPLLWVIKRKMAILTVSFSGIVGSGIGYLGMSWCVEKRGPVFTAAFSPLIQIAIAVIDVSIRHEPLHLGSVLGSVLVIMGLYFLLWGKYREALKCSPKPLEGDDEDQKVGQIVRDEA